MKFAARGRNLALAARRTDRLEELRDETDSPAHPRIRVAIRQLDVDVHDGRLPASSVSSDEELRRPWTARSSMPDWVREQPLGTGYFLAPMYRPLATNFLGALAQSEAALETLPSAKCRARGA